MIASVPNYLTFAGITSADATRDASLAAVIAACERAVKQLCRPYQLEAGTGTWVLNAPWSSPWLVLPVVPVRSITALYYRSDAKGDASLFTSDYLLTQYTDYMLEVDDKVNNFAKGGRVRRLNRAAWGVQQVRPPGRLAFDPAEEPGSIYVTCQTGHLTPPSDVAQAVNMMTSKVYHSRKFGAIAASASLNGASYSLPAGAVAGALRDPNVLDLLAPYMPAMRVG